MIECVFTLDYEIYGNGKGSLRDLVLDPTRRLAELFQEFGAPFVVFAEAVEFARMEETESDPDTARVRAQLRELRAAGHEIALHLHPWWANARYENGHWRLDWSERNICTLEPNRVEAIVSEAIRYLRDGLDDPRFTPLSFRSGLWVMQPTAVIANVLARHGVRVDSSVFKGGRVHGLGLDYRPALANDGFWRFGSRRKRAGPSRHALGNPHSYANGAVLANARPQAPEAAKESAQAPAKARHCRAAGATLSVSAILASWTSAE